MKFKEIVMFIVFAVIIAGLILLIFSDNREQNLSSVSDQPKEQAQGGQSSTDNHHGAVKSVDQIAFNNLLGRKAPDFSLESYDGSKITLSSLKGKNVVLFFNEGLMCYPACWNQIVAFGKDQRFNNKNTVALNIVIDPKAEWKSAIEKMPELSAATVLFDNNRSVSTTYGVLNLSSSMHRG